MAELEKVYMVKSEVGQGHEKDPSRILMEFFDKDLNKLGEIDNWKIEQDNKNAEG